MKTNKLIYIAIAIFLVAVATFVFSSGILNRDSVNNQNSPNSELSRYRSSNIPEDCRLPDYQDDVGAWVEHLGHHGNTKYCIDFFK